MLPYNIIRKENLVLMMFSVLRTLFYPEEIGSGKHAQIC